MPLSLSSEIIIGSGNRDIAQREKSEKLKFAKVGESETFEKLIYREVRGFEKSEFFQGEGQTRCLDF